MKTKLAVLLESIKSTQGTKFVSLTYKTKENMNAKGVIVSGGELARYTIIIGFSYNSLVKKSITELELLLPSLTTDLEKQAALEVMESMNKTVSAHERGEQNDDYTKRGQYVSLFNGMNLNTVDNSLQLFGLVQSKVVLSEGVYKEVKSAPLTIEKNKIKKNLSVSKFREFAIDPDTIDSVRINGETIEFVPSLSTYKTTEVDLTDTTKKDSVVSV